jgi:hypothetical protein
MRITLNLDDDVLASARTLAARRGVPIGTIISDLARHGLACAEPATCRNGIRLFPVRPDAGSVTPELVKILAEGVDEQQWPRFEIKAKACGFRSEVDVRRLNQVNDELEVEGFRRKLRRDC